MRSCFLVVLFSLSLLFFTSETKAQCPMCKTAIESAMKDKNNTKGKGLNRGILYLLSMPYLAVGIVGVLWYRNSKKKQINL